MAKSSNGKQVKRLGNTTERGGIPRKGLTGWTTLKTAWQKQQQLDQIWQNKVHKEEVHQGGKIWRMLTLAIALTLRIEQLKDVEVIKPPV